MGVKISKCYSSYSYDSFSAKLFLRIPCDNPHKTCFLEFEIWKKINTVANGKMQKCQYLGNGQPQRKTQWNLGLGGYFRKCMCNFWPFFQIPSFMPKYGSFGNLSVSRKPLPVEQKNKLNFDPLGWKEGICPTSGPFFKFQLSCPNIAILKICLYLGNRCP